MQMVMDIRGHYEGERNSGEVSQIPTEVFQCEHMYAKCCCTVALTNVSTRTDTFLTEN